MLDDKGNTAAYLLYTYTRIRYGSVYYMFSLWSKFVEVIGYWLGINSIGHCVIGIVFLLSNENTIPVN